MKIWHSYGSEHSSNLVMIGHFKSAADASKAVEIIQAITDQARLEQDEGSAEVGTPRQKYGNAMLDVLGKLNVAIVAPHEIEQFLYEVDVSAVDKDVIVKTEEYDISGFLKVLVGRGAKVEVFSAHDHPGSGYGRGR